MVIQQFGDPREFIIRMPLTTTSSEELAKRMSARGFAPSVLHRDIGR